MKNKILMTLVMIVIFGIGFFTALLFDDNDLNVKWTINENEELIIECEGTNELKNDLKEVESTLKEIEKENEEKDIVELEEKNKQVVGEKLIQNTIDNANVFKGLDTINEINKRTGNTFLILSKEEYDLSKKRNPMKIINGVKNFYGTKSEFLACMDDVEEYYSSNLYEGLDYYTDREKYYPFDPNGLGFGFLENAPFGHSGFDCLCGSYSEFKTKASSTLPNEGNISYISDHVIARMNVLDDARIPKLTAWVEGASGSGIGEYIEVEYYKSHVTEEDEELIKMYGKPDYKNFYKELCIVNGYAASEKTWIENNRVKRLKMYFNGEYIGIINLLDTYKPQYIDIKESNLISKKVRGNGVFRFEILEVYRGTKYDDTCITGIDILQEKYEETK